MKTLIIYESVYGHTKQYAQRIAQAIGADFRPADEVSGDALHAYDTIVFGAPIYIGRIKGIRWLSGQAEGLTGRRVFLFTTGMTPPDDAQAYAETMRQLPGNVTLAGAFHLPGAVDPGKLKPSHRLIFGMVQRMAGAGKAPEGMAFPAAEGDETAGGLDPSAIHAMVEAIK